MGCQDIGSFILNFKRLSLQTLYCAQSYGLLKIHVILVKKTIVQAGDKPYAQVLEPASDPAAG